MAEANATPALADERFAEHTPNYRYLLNAVSGGVLGRPARVLDYGCGRGQFVGSAISVGIDVHGVDAFADGWANKESEIVPAAAGRVRALEGGRIPFPDSRFDAVTANFVFEHVKAPPAALAEIARVLKPDGLFLALFPTRDVWYEGHAGLYFAHWLRRTPAALRTYLMLAHRLGLGYHRAGASPKAWAARWQRSFEQEIFFHSFADVTRWWRAAFGAAPRSAAVDFMLYRVTESRKLRPFAGLARAAPGLLEWTCRIRAGRVLLTRNAKSG